MAPQSMGRWMSSEYRLGRVQKAPGWISSCRSATADHRCWISDPASAAEFPMLGALVPCMFVVVTVMIVIVEAFARLGDDAGGCKRNQPHQEAAFNDPLCSFHLVAPGLLTVKAYPMPHWAPVRVLPTLAVSVGPTSLPG